MLVVVIPVRITVPVVGWVPLHAPLAVHDVAFVEDHVSVDDPPDVTEVGEAETDMLGVLGTTTSLCVVADTLAVWAETFPAAS